MTTKENVFACFWNLKLHFKVYDCLRKALQEMCPFPEHGFVLQVGHLGCYM